MENSTSVSAPTLMCYAGIRTAAGFGELTKNFRQDLIFLDYEWIALFKVNFL